MFRGNWLRFEGFYERDLRTGPGKVIFRAGEWKGIFEKGQPHGEGIFTSAEGLETKGRWEQGILISSNEDF